MKQPMKATPTITLAKHLRQIHPEWSWNECRAAIESGRVTVDGVVITDDTMRPVPDAAIIVHAKPQTKPPDRAEADIPLHVYFHDQHIIVVEKPSGIESVPFETKKDLDRKAHARRDTLIDIARHWLEQKEHTKLPPLKVVHRLDKGTSGIIVFARTVVAERHLGQLFRKHDIKRSYIAFCPGLPKSGTISSRLVENRGDGKRGSTRNKNLGKEAITHVVRLETRKFAPGDVISMIRCTLETGRTHQIRIHMCEEGHPLCGETVYTAPTGQSANHLKTFGIPRIGLHAEELGFTHPITGEAVHWKSPLPHDLADWWHRDETPPPK